jgi:hypothetical protein
MEITKEKLMSIILETSQEVDEMGRVVNKTTHKGKTVKQSKVYDEDGTHIGFKLSTNPDDDYADAVTIIFNCEGDTFKEKEPKLYEFLVDKYGPNIGFSSDVCPGNARVHSQKRQYYKFGGGEWDIKQKGYEGPKKNLEVETRNIKVFLPILKSEFDQTVGTAEQQKPNSTGVEFKKILQSRSIPGIVIGDKRYTDKYDSSFSNSNILFHTHTFNMYQTSEQFLLSVVDNIEGNEDSYKPVDDYQARLYNKKYRKWEQERKADDTYKGKTSGAYSLNKQGYIPDDVNVLIKMDFEVVGKLQGSSFTWTISMENKFGRKRSDEVRLKQGLKQLSLTDDNYLDDKKITKSVTVEVNEVNPNQPIMEDGAVVEALRQVIYDFKQTVESIDPAQMLSVATLNRSDVERVDEQEVNNIIKNVIGEMFKKK